MPRQVLITGGAGFIGSHLADHLLSAGYSVRALDVLDPQVHGPARARPKYLANEVELVVGDVRNSDVVRRALVEVDAVFHLAAAVGVGQSMYEIVHFTSTNNLGTATLMEALSKRPVERLIVASSMSIYGEGLYRTSSGTYVDGVERRREQFLRGDWEVYSRDGEVLSPLPTPESKHPALASVYALSKFDQERLCLMIASAYGIPAVALRFFNTYGPRQALSNPYTGVLAIFAARLLNGKPPLIFEDGQQQRDFVSVYDVARACRLAFETPDAAGHIFNIGSGVSRSVCELARRLSEVLGKGDVEPEITGNYRVGDIRHCFADISHAREVLGFKPDLDLDDGLTDLAEWLAGAQAEDHVPYAHDEMKARGLSVSSQQATVSRAQRVDPPLRQERPILITGGAGFIGCNLAHRLLSSGKRVLIFDNLSRTEVERNVRWLRQHHGSAVEIEIADIRNAAAVRNAVDRCRQVFHLAAQVAVTTSLFDPVEDFMVNGRGTLNVLEAIRAQRNSLPLVFTSTNKVYGALDDVPLVSRGTRYEPADDTMRLLGVGEQRRLHFNSPYGCSKGSADQYISDYARTYGVPSAVFRMSCIYGPHQHGTEEQGWIAHFLMQAVRGAPIVIFGDGLQVRDVLFVSDLVDALILAQEHLPAISGRAFNIGGGPANALSLLELLSLIAELHGTPPNLAFRDWRVGDQRYYVSDTRQFGEATGWTPRVSVQRGVGRLYRWIVDSGIARATGRANGGAARLLDLSETPHPAVAERGL